MRFSTYQLYSSEHVMSLRAPAFLYQRGTIRTAQNSLLEEKVALCDQPGAPGPYLPLIQLLFFQLVGCRVVRDCLVQESNGTRCPCPCVCWWELPLSIRGITGGQAAHPYWFLRNESPEVLFPETEGAALVTGTQGSDLVL